MDKELVEEIAELIYLNHDGMTPEEYRELCGFSRRKWRIPGSAWDTDPNELCEWERDEYREQARVVLELLNNKGLLK